MKSGAPEAFHCKRAVIDYDQKKVVNQMQDKVDEYFKVNKVELIIKFSLEPGASSWDYIGYNCTRFYRLVTALTDII